jgi:cellulose synthase/poly-beta-1,6-N-acetylglucosamine synthase-like glycosyltransferase
MLGNSSAHKDLSVVVTTRNRSEQCARMCDILKDQLGKHSLLEAEIILVFDGCSQYDWACGERLYKTVLLPRRLGIAGARNVGLDQADSPIVAFLDDDALPADTWLSSLLRGLTAYPDHIAFGGRVIGTDDTNLYSQLRDLVYYYETFGSWYVNESELSDMLGTPYVNGGNAAYRKAALVAAGGFNRVLPAYSDVEMGRRLKLRAHGVLLAGMSITHDHPAAFPVYLERCLRSGKARALIWRVRRYREHSPLSVFGAVVRNILWVNHVRARRLSGHRVQAAMVLFCQEVAHGYGYTTSLLQHRQVRHIFARRRLARP